MEKKLTFPHKSIVTKLPFYNRTWAFQSHVELFLNCFMLDKATQFAFKTQFSELENSKKQSYNFWTKLGSLVCLTIAAAFSKKEFLVR